MALSDLKVFSEKSYSTMVELLDYNVELFNGATRGGLVLTSGLMQGDNSTEAFWANQQFGEASKRLCGRQPHHPGADHEGAFQGQDCCWNLSYRHH